MKNQIDLSADEISNVKKSTEEMNGVIKLIDKRCTIIERTNTPKPSRSIKNDSSSAPSFVDIIKSQKQQQQQKQVATKRRHEQMVATGNGSQGAVPKVKIGKRTDNGGLAVVTSNVKQKNKFDRALYVSRLANTISPDKMNEYVTTYAKLNIDDFKCSLLVKKDADISKLAYVSYKIDVNEENFDCLANEDLWPEGVFIRPFVPTSRKMEDFMEHPIDTSNDHDTQPTKVTKIDSSAQIMSSQLQSSDQIAMNEDLIVLGSGTMSDTIIDGANDASKNE